MGKNGNAVLGMDGIDDLLNGMLGFLLFQCGGLLHTCGDDVINALENVCAADVVLHAGEQQHIILHLAVSPLPVVGQREKIVVFALIQCDALFGGLSAVGYGGVCMQIALIPAASLSIQFHLCQPRNFNNYTKSPTKAGRLL